MPFGHCEALIKVNVVIDLLRQPSDVGQVVNSSIHFVIDELPVVELTLDELS